MSQANVKIVKVAYEAFATGGLDRWVEQFAEDVEYRAVEGAPDDVGPIHGREALRAYFQDWIDTFDEFWFEAIELIDAGGDTVVAVERYGGRAKLSGIETDQTEAELFTIRDGKIARCREYGTATKSRSRRAVGVAPDAPSLTPQSEARARRRATRRRWRGRPALPQRPVGATLRSVNAWRAPDPKLGRVRFRANPPGSSLRLTASSTSVILSPLVVMLLSVGLQTCTWVLTRRAEIKAPQFAGSAGSDRHVGA